MNESDIESFNSHIMSISKIYTKRYPDDPMPKELDDFSGDQLEKISMFIEDMLEK